MTDYKALPQPLIETIGGFLGGVASSLVAHPLDLLKTRLQGTSPPKPSAVPYLRQSSDGPQLTENLHLKLLALCAFYGTLHEMTVSSRAFTVGLRPTPSATP